MPLYVFKCPTCGSEKEVLQKYSDPKPTCVECKKDKEEVVMNRILANTTFILNGSGWYRDGYSSKK